MFYLIDIIIAACILITLHALYFFNKLSSLDVKLYWIGCFIGSLWEIPMCLAIEYGALPPARFLTPPIVPIIVMGIIHCFWDGFLFLVGIWLVRGLIKQPHFTKFRWAELALFLIWGQLQEFTVEIVSTFSDGWEYLVYWWNPSLFQINGKHITLIPQLIWLMAPILYYAVVLDQVKRQTKEY